MPPAPPLLLLVCLPWQPFMTQALQSGWLWWPYALTRMVDLLGLVSPLPPCCCSQDTS